MFTRKKAFTLVEMTISVTLFAVVASVSMVVTSNILKSTKKIQAQIFLYTEAQALMDQLDQAVNRNTIDYEAYFARNVGHQGSVDTGWATPNYGDYQQTFMDPGTAGIPDTADGNDGVYSTIDGYGAACSSPTTDEYPTDCPDQIPLTASLDIDTGEHPYPDKNGTSDGSSGTSSNAMCEYPDTCSGIGFYDSNELILINGSGDRRTIFVKELYSTDNYGISKVEMDGTDSDNDGAVDDWVCASAYEDCTGPGNVPNVDDLTVTTGDSDDFEFISPSLINITNFYVYIAPIEDPYRAFAEDSLSVQIQPQVTIVFTATLSSDYGTFLGTTPTITLQRTISTGVYSKINSYAE